MFTIAVSKKSGTAALRAGGKWATREEVVPQGTRIGVFGGGP